MKKTTLCLFITVCIFIAFLASCEKQEEKTASVETLQITASSLQESSLSESSGDEMSEITQSGTSIPTDPETGLPIYVPGSIKLYTLDPKLYPNGKTYRDCWYMDPTNFVLGQNSEDINYFLYSVKRNPESMLCVQYIEYFNVSKEVFVAELERVRKFYESLGADMSLEESELPNADILYTFDDEIINNYYRYE